MNKVFVIIFCILQCFVFQMHCQASAVTSGQKLTAGDGAGLAKFGQSVAISGNYAIIGATGAYEKEESAGAAYIFHFEGSTWTQVQKLTASDGGALAKFGQAVAISGNYAIVGAVGDNDNGESAGAAYIFTSNGSSWTQLQKLTASDGDSWVRFGQAVAIFGNYAIVGADGDNDNGESAGAAYIFYFDGTNWTQVQKLTASDGIAWSRFGQAVAISADYAVVGAPGESSNGDSAGAVYIFRFDGSGWSYVQKLTASDGAAWDKFGQAIDISGNSIVVGAAGDDDNGEASGSVYMFCHDGIGWVPEQKILAGDGAASDYFGQAVSIDGDFVVVGACGRDDIGISSGSAYVFSYDGTAWMQEQKILAGDGAASDYFGQTVGISEYHVIVGAYGDDDHGELSGSIHTYLGVTSELFVVPQFSGLSSTDTDRVVTFDATGSLCHETVNGVDEEQDCVYEWDFGGTGTVVGGNGVDVVVYQYDIAGDYDVSLSLTEVVGGTASTRVITVTALDVEPQIALADFATSVDGNRVSLTVSFSAAVTRAYVYWGDRTRSVSTDPQADFVDGMISHTYSRSGRSYNIRVMIIDAGRNRINYTYSEDADLTVFIP